MAVFVRGAGAHVAERVRPAPGSSEEKRLDLLADDPKSGWSRVEEPKPARPARKSAKKDAAPADPGEGG